MISSKSPKMDLSKPQKNNLRELYIENFLTAGYCLRSPESGQSGCNLAVKLTDIMICKGIRRRVSNHILLINQYYKIIFLNPQWHKSFVERHCQTASGGSPCALVNDARSQREDTLGKWKLFEEI